MGIVPYNGVHYGHVDGRLQHSHSEGPRASRQMYFGGEALGGNPIIDRTRSLPAEYARYGNAEVSHHSKFGKVNARHADITTVQTAHPNYVSPASLRTSSSTVTPEQLDHIATEGIRLSVEGMQLAVNDQDETASQPSLPKKPSPRGSSLNLTPESQTTVFREPDSKIHYQFHEILSMETPSPRAASNLKTPPEADIRRVSKLRRRVKMLRSQVQSHRALVRSKQTAMSQADEQYIKMVRTRHVTEKSLATADDSELKVLEDLWRQCQIARDQYGPVEVELSEMEDRLEHEEEKLERAEERFYEQLHAKDSSVLILHQDHESKHRSSSSKTSSKSSTSQDTEYEPIYRDYLGRLGDQDIQQERHEALLNERAALEEEQERRRRVGTDLDAEDLEFLANFANLIEFSGRELQEVSEDVQLLRQKCVEQGVLDPVETSAPQLHAPEASTPALQPASGPLMEDESQMELPSTPSKLSQLQIPPENNDEDSRIFAGYAGYRNFIDAWLLDKLRSSTIEILQLAAYVASRLKMMDMQNWQAEALRLWYSDSTEKESDAEEPAKNDIQT